MQTIAIMLARHLELVALAHAIVLACAFMLLVVRKSCRGLVVRASGAGSAAYTAGAHGSGGGRSLSGILGRKLAFTLEVLALELVIGLVTISSSIFVS